MGQREVKGLLAGAGGGWSEKAFWKNWGFDCILKCKNELGEGRHSQ